MSKPKKRTRVTAGKTSSSGITIREVWKDRHGSQYLTHLVQGWKEDGKWKRREFKDRKRAEAFVAKKTIEMKNAGRPHDLVMSTLNQEQQDEAESAIRLLKGVYSLTEAVEYFLKNHRSPDFTISLSNAVSIYLEDKEHEIRPPTLRSIRQTLNRLKLETGDPNVNEIGGAAIRHYLKGLRKKDGITKASRRSWNIHRSNLDGFFKWAMDPTLSENHPFTFTNPVNHTKAFTKKQVEEEQSDEIITTAIEDTKKLFSVLMRWRGGSFVPAFALLYFAGIRPAELVRLAPMSEKMINLRTGIITIPASVSKTKEKRKTRISKNLAAWLKAFPGPIMPPNFKRRCDLIRKHFALTQDEPRHSFISYHVALNRSIGDVALQAGNSESIVKKHYLDLFAVEEGEAFFAIVPDLETRRAVVAKEITHSAPGELKAV